jgi:hypothetical protein
LSCRGVALISECLLSIPRLLLVNITARCETASNEDNHGVMIKLVLPQSWWKESHSRASQGLRYCPELTLSGGATSSMYCPHYARGIVANQLKSKKRSFMERFLCLDVSY